MGAGHRSLCIQCFSLLSRMFSAAWDCGGNLMNSRTLIVKSSVPLWLGWEKWSPTASVCFLCLMLKKCEWNLVAMLFLV